MTEQTVSAYSSYTDAYRADSHALPAHVKEQLEVFAGLVGAGGRVLEIGSGGGRDATYLETLGVLVRRTDITPAFVDLLREDGHTADVVDPLKDDLTDPARPGRLYDAVWANACLLHVARADLPTVLTRLHAATRPGGLLRFSVKEGEGEAWSTHGAVAAPRLFVYWTTPDLRAVVEDSGWTSVQVGRASSPQGTSWLEVWARH